MQPSTIPPTASVNNTTIPSIHLPSRAAAISRLVAKNVFNIDDLYPPQVDVLTRLALMKFKDYPIKPSSVLFVHPTGGGKSLVRDVHSTIFRGISLTIVPVLSLGADLAIKVRQKASQVCGRVTSIHIDEIQNLTDAKRIIDSIEALPLNTMKTVMLFASPQALVDKPYWKKFIAGLIDSKMLRFIAVDEIQLFVHYGLSFRSQFAMLSTTIFKQIKTGRFATKIPVLFMTASCNNEMFEQLKLLTGLAFYPDNRNIFWPGSSQLMKRSVCTRVVYSNRPLSCFISTFGADIKSNPDHRFIFYANSRKMIEKCAETYGAWLDKSLDFQSDFLKIVGTMKKEEKFHAMKLFCIEHKNDKDSFNPQVLLATSGAANCGIDNKNIYCVFHGEIPPSCEDMVQEEGRAGRRADANPMTDSYTVCISLESLLKLWGRIYSGTENKLSYRKSLLYDVDVMLGILVIPMHCIKSVLAHKASNPFTRDSNTPVYLPHPCKYSCSFCLGDYTDITPPLNRAGVCIVLMDLFSGSNRIGGDITFLPVLCDKIKIYPGCNRLVFGVNSKKPPAPIMVKKMLLVLIAAKILSHTATVGTSTETNVDNVSVTIKAVLGYSMRTNTNDIPIYAMFDDMYWQRIKVLPPHIINN